MTCSPAIVRPWLKAGLSVLLLENEQRVVQLRGINGLHGAEAPESPARATFRDPSPARREYRREKTVPVPAPAAPVLPARSVQMPAEPAPSGLLATPGALPVEEWPSGWLALKNRRPLPPRPLVLWTYAGLGEDLTGTPDEARRQVIVRMLMELRHPGGTHVFWPCGLTGESREDGSALFWSGVKLLNPRVLLLFGSDARDILAMPRTLLPFCQERVNGRLVIQLPMPQALAGDEPSFKRALAFLSRLLSFCANR